MAQEGGGGGFGPLRNWRSEGRRKGKTDVYLEGPRKESIAQDCILEKERSPTLDAIKPEKKDVQVLWKGY